MTPVHELLHTLGFVHEHTRPDRDKFVEVHEAHRGLKSFSSENFLNALIFCISQNVSMAKANYIGPKMVQITIFMTVIVLTDKMEPYRLKLVPRNLILVLEHDSCKKGTICAGGNPKKVIVPYGHCPLGKPIWYGRGKEDSSPKHLHCTY